MINQLQIYVYGPMESGFLDLPPDMVLDMEEMADAFDENFSVGIFSLPATVPWTPYNRRLLGFAERVENNVKRAVYFKCIVYSNGFPELVNAKMTLLEKTGSFKYTRGNFSFSIAGSKGLFGSLIQNKKLNTLTLGGIINFTTESRVFATSVMKGAFPQYPYLRFAPVAIENFFDTNRPDYVAATDFLFKDTANNILITGSTLNAWSFGRPTAYYSGSTIITTTTLTSPGDNQPLYKHSDVRTIPFFSLKYVFRKVFEENGYKPSGAFIDDPEWDELTIFNNHAIENYFTPFIDSNRQIVPGNHVPDIYILPFLQGVCSLLNIYPVFNDDNTVKFYYKVKDFTVKRIAKLTSKCSSDFESAFNDSNNYDDNNPANNSTGYILNYTWDSNDQYQGDRVKELTVNIYDQSIWIGDKLLAGTVATLAALQTLTITLTTDTLIYVEADNMFYLCADAISTPTKWDCWAENLCAYSVGLNGKTVEIPISTLCTYVVDNSLTGLLEKQIYLGCRQTGSYLNDKGVTVTNPFGLRVFFVRNQLVGGVSVPTTSNYNRAADNSKISPYNLTWRGNDGLAVNFHKAWQDLQLQMEIVKTDIDSDKKLLQEMSQANVYEIEGIQFLPYKRERQIPANKAMVQYIIPI